MRELILRVRPWSPSAFVAAVLAIALAASIQEIFVLILGAKLYFAAFFPAILAASLLAGAPAGIFATLLTVPIVWWAFMPPYFEFEPLTTDDYHRIAMFALGSALVISFANLYREALVLFRK
jgi:K+-sensing histidine kinase KdpD